MYAVSYILAFHIIAIYYVANNHYKQFHDRVDDVETSVHNKAALYMVDHKRGLGFVNIKRCSYMVLMICILYLFDVM